MSGDLERPVATNSAVIASTPLRRISPSRFWCGAILTVGVCAFATERPLWKTNQVFGFAENVQIGEAEAIWGGRLDLPERQWDTSLKEGKVYSYFPPMFTFVAAAMTPIFGGVPYLFIVGLAGVVPLLAFTLFSRLTGSVRWSVVLSLGLVMGTSLWPVVDKTLRGAAPYQINHVLATIGLLIFLIAFSREGRTWPACVGLVIAGLSRQLTLVYAFPLGYAAARQALNRRTAAPLVGVVAACGIVLGVSFTMNALKFGSPLDSGYMLNYVGRDDAFARDARTYGLFAAHYVPRNLYYASLGLPRLHRIEIANEEQWYLQPNDMGAGILWTTPLLLWLLFEWRCIWGDQKSRALFPAVAAIFVALMFWHGTGSVQRGFSRYSLDFVPVLFAMIAPGCLETPRRRWLTIGMVAWSVLYFAVLLPRPNIRIW